MIDNSNGNIPMIQILWAIFISFICAFAKKLNEYAKLPAEQHNFILFTSETLLSGVSGVLIGLLAMYFSHNIYLIFFCSGVGGILGIRLIKIVLKTFLILKNVDLNKINLDEELDENEKKK